MAACWCGGLPEGSVDLAGRWTLAGGGALRADEPGRHHGAAPEALAFAEMYQLPVLTIEDLAAWREING